MPLRPYIWAQRFCLKMKQMKVQKPEILAPAGTYDCLVAAVNSGADAVYFAGKGTIMMATVWFPVFFWIIFLIQFVYTYKWGVKREFNMAVGHILQNKDTQVFFTPERGMVLFYEDKAEYLTNEQRRYFSYDVIKNIKIIYLFQQLNLM